MRILGHALGWLFAALFGLLTLSMILQGSWVQALVLGLLALLCLPPLGGWVRRGWGRALPPWMRGGAILLLLGGWIASTIAVVPDSIYKTPEIQARFMALYDAKMKGWPLPYEDRFIETRYGKVHVIVSGPPEAPPLLLLHASGVASWSWKFNAADLSRHFRLYAIDLIGDVGKSVFTDLNHIMKTGRDQADLYAEIADRLGVAKAFVVGASEGGFIGSNFAMFYPDRVEKLALLGPMGYSGALSSALRIMLAQMFPLRSVQEATFAWAFSDSAKLQEEYGQWFRLVMSGYRPAKVPPLPFSAQERRQIKVPVLFVFGKRDHLVGDPEAARALVQDIPDVRVEVVDAGHLMGGEQPQQVDDLLVKFFLPEQR